MRFIGGLLDGKETARMAKFIVLPYGNGTYADRVAAWLDRYGVAHGWAMAGGEAWHGPPPPSFPLLTYRLERDEDGELCYRLSS